MYPKWPTYSSSEIKKVKEILNSGKVNYWTGDNCNNFENKFAKHFNKKFGISVATGSVVEI